MYITRINGLFGVSVLIFMCAMIYSLNISRFPSQLLANITGITITISALGIIAALLWTLFRIITANK